MNVLLFEVALMFSEIHNRCISFFFFFKYYRKKHESVFYHSAGLSLFSVCVFISCVVCGLRLKVMVISEQSTPTPASRSLTEIQLFFIRSQVRTQQMIVIKYF